MKLEDVPTVILVGSGKGGVGKTTVASDIAKTARDTGATVGLIDADVSTPNSPEVLGGEDVDFDEQRLSTGDSLLPPKANGVQVISQGIVVPDDVPVVGDGQWRAGVILDYLENVEWEDGTDLVIIDSPPGSGEELEVIAGESPISEGIIVTTPHPSSVRDATKTHEYFNVTEIPHSVVVNMAYIPGGNISHHVSESCDFDELQGIGEAKSESIGKLMDDEVANFNLFGYDPEDGVDIDAPELATIPYTPAYEDRAEFYDELVDQLLQTPEVEA